MNLESLANELFIELFEYLSIADLLRAFNGLNSRLATLISRSIQCSHHVDCRSISKSQLDFVCQQHFLSIADRIISLTLSNNDETPEQINRFFSHGLKLNQFIHLRSLSLYQFCSENIMEDMMTSWCQLPSLTHLKLSECYFRYQQNDDLQTMVNSIWSLSRLTHCHLDLICQWRTAFIAPTVISSSLKSLVIQGIDCPANELTYLFQNTVRLRHFSAKINTVRGHVWLPLTTSSITALKLKFLSSVTSINGIINFLENMRNLRQLTVETLDIFIDGQQWKEIITSFLPKLKVFRLKMEFYFRDRINTKRYVDQLLHSFQTCFWLEEHQWFVRCHYHPESSSNYVCLYTLPYSFAIFPRIEVAGCQSTCSDDEHQSWSYDHVHTLTYRVPLTEDLILHHCRFVNIRHLSVFLGVNDQFWTIVPRFACLVSLEVSLHGRIHNAQSQLQAILDQAPRLTLLKLGSWRTCEVPVAEIISASVRQLDLRESDHWYSDSECLTLIDSLLGMQCEFLRINVANRMSILDLVTKMTNLRSLNVQCEGDEYRERLPASNDEFVTWLKCHLPSTCTITWHTRYIYDILLWIR